MYLVIELQTTGGVTTALVDSYASYELAQQKYYLVLSYAAVSTLDTHAAMIIDPRGRVWKSESFVHSQPPAPTPDASGTDV